ncbi:hypothetical protein [Streptomyces sp. NPDC055287]
MQLNAGRRAAEAGDWVAAGHAFVRAAMEGSAEGAELATQVAVELVPLAYGGAMEAAALLAGINLEYFDASALPMAVSYAAWRPRRASPPDSAPTVTCW